MGGPPTKGSRGSGKKLLSKSLFKITLSEVTNRTSREVVGKGQEGRPILDLRPAPEVVKNWIVAEFSKMGPGAVSWGLKVARCESNFRPWAYNTSGASGVFQFMSNTFYANAKRAGIEKAELWNVHDQIKVAAYMKGQHQEHQWECK